MGRALLAGLAIALVGAAPAQAGRLIATGHDADHHCAGGQPQCAFLKTVIDYVRAGAPNPNAPVLVLDHAKSGGAAADLPTAITNMYGSSLPNRVVDPKSPEFAGLALTTSNFSAIVVASDSSCGGCDLNDTGSGTPDSDAIAARKADIASFFNAGGGIVALAGADHGGATGGDNAYYAFVPLPLGGAPVNPPFMLTSVGTSIGLTDNPNRSMSEINCCPTHNSFTPPGAGSPLQVAETDSMGLAETLVVQGSISGGKFVPPPAPSSTATPPAFGKGGVISGLPSTKKCVSKRVFRIHIRRHAGITYTEAIVFVNRKQVGVDRINGGPSSVVDLRNLPSGTFSVEITVITTTGQIIKGTRTYHTCRKHLPSHGPPKL